MFWFEHISTPIQRPFVNNNIKKKFIKKKKMKKHFHKKLNDTNKYHNFHKTKFNRKQNKKAKNKIMKKIFMNFVCLNGLEWIELTTDWRFVVFCVVVILTAIHITVCFSMIFAIFTSITTARLVNHWLTLAVIRLKLYERMKKKIYF